MSDHKRRRLALIAVILGMMGFIYASIPQDIAFEIVGNNTDLCQFNTTSKLCEGSRLNNTVYWANDSAIILNVFGHANVASQTGGVFIYRNGVLYAPQSGRPLAAPEETWRDPGSVIIPKGWNYSVIWYNVHHVEWREDQILSGRNGTLSINQTIAGGGCTGDCSFNNLEVNSLGKNDTFNMFGFNIFLNSPFINSDGVSSSKITLVPDHAEMKHENATIATSFYLGLVDAYMTVSNGTYSKISVFEKNATIIINSSRNYLFNETVFDMGGANLTNCSNCGGNQNLSQVLTAGNDAKNQNITNLSYINNVVLVNQTSHVMHQNVQQKWVNDSGVDISSTVNTNNELYNMLFTANHPTQANNLISFRSINGTASAVGFPFFLGQRARGYIAENGTAYPQGLQKNDFMFRLSVSGWQKNSTVWSGSKGTIDFIAEDEWNLSSTPVYIDISTTPIGSTTVSSKLRIWGNGTVQIYSLAGVGNAYVCTDSTGKTFRGSPGC